MTESPTGNTVRRGVGGSPQLAIMKVPPDKSKEPLPGAIRLSMLLLLQNKMSVFP